MKPSQLSQYPPKVWGTELHLSVEDYRLTQSGLVRATWRLVAGHIWPPRQEFGHNWSIEFFRCIFFTV